MHPSLLKSINKLRALPDHWMTKLSATLIHCSRRPNPGQPAYLILVRGTGDNNSWPASSTADCIYNT